MLTKTDYALAEEIVNGLSLPSELGPDEDSYFDDEWLVCQLDDICEDANIEYGISKVVIIPEEGNFVIKIPFNGMYYHYWDEEADCYDGAEFSYYHEACAPDSSDYCWDEVIKIEKACEMGFDKLFPATSFLMEKDGHRVYIQEKVRTVGHFNPGNISEDSRKRAESLNFHYKKCNNIWRAAVIEFYGEDYWVAFCDWDFRSDVNILSDMHSGNYGYDMEGHPIILDASGFRE